MGEGGVALAARPPVGLKQVLQWKLQIRDSWVCLFGDS